MKKKLIKANHLSGGQYFDNKNLKRLRFKTPMLRSDLLDYSDVHIDVKRRISVTGTFNAKGRNKKNNAPFISSI